ncbi:BatA domain-containing protein [Xanthomonas sp. NCPPB 1067]|uniref:BatA domain-containing protein n=1 Tax=Xanthomonas sp. NCPPB 1067 TaxID=487524 RepID=UPI001E3E1F25|nr:BatA domain-containing protein [Xanthomonas sp. NCPPB 1067]
MNLLLLFPAGLAALAALLMPLLIHLARRSEHRPTDFAALRWLRAMPRPRHRVRLDEWPLLLLRLLLLAALALLLAEPALRDRPDSRPRIAVSPGVDLAAARALPHADDAQWLWLAPGFAPIDVTNTDHDRTAPGTPQPIGSLLRELDAGLPAEATLSVIVPAQWGALDAQRVQLARAVHWQVLPGRSPLAPAPALAPPSLLAVADTPAMPALRYLRAVHAAWALPGSLPVTTPAAAQPARWAPGTVVIWLSSTPPSASVIAWVAAGGQLVLGAQAPVPHASAAPLQAVGEPDGDALLDAAPLGRGRLLRWSAPLEPQHLPAVLEADFPARLRTALQPPPTPQTAPAQTQSPQRGAAIRLRVPPQSLAPWLIGLVLLLFALERWLATAPRRNVAP